MEMAGHPAGEEGPQLVISPQGCSFSRTSGGSLGQPGSHVNALPAQSYADLPSMGVSNPCVFRHEGHDPVSHVLVSCSSTPGMGVPLAEGTRTVPVEYVLPAGYGNTGVVRSVEGDAQIRQGYTGNVLLPPSVGGMPQLGDDPQFRGQSLAAGNVAQFAGRDASGGYGLSEGEALQLRNVSNGPGPPISEILAGANFEDDRWTPWLHRIVSPTGNEAFGQASARVW